MKKEIVYIGDFQLTSRNVQAQLVINNGKLLAELGYKVTYIGVNKNIAHDRDILDTSGTCSGFNIFEVPFTNSKSDVTYYMKHVKDIIQLLNSKANDLYAVITYQSPTFALFLYSLYRWCNKNGVLYITNCADLPLIEHGNFISRFLKKCNWGLMEFVNKQFSDGIIAVSRYVNDFYAKKGRPSVIIPPLFDTSEISFPPKRSQIVTFVYAGTPFPTDGREVDKYSYKDRLDIIIVLLGKVFDKGLQFRFNIYGLSKSEYVEVIDWQKELVEKLSDVVQFHGRCSSERVKKMVSAADFSINLRNINRMTQAGFSTKFVESISCGTPIVTNRTSDIELYLEEGINGYFLDLDDLDKSFDVLCKIVQTNRETLDLMKDACYESRLFDYHNFLEAMKDFISELNSDYGTGGRINGTI